MRTRELAAQGDGLPSKFGVTWTSLVPTSFGRLGPFPSLLVLFLLAFALRLAFLDHQSLWGDRALIYEPSGYALPNGELEAIPVHLTQGPAASARRLKPPYPADLPLGPLRVIGYYFPKQARPGETVTMSLYWLAEEAPTEDYSLALRLGAGSERVSPLVPGYPSSRWRAGEAVISQHRVVVPASADGRQALSVGLEGSAGLKLLPLAQVEVAKVNRNYREPVVERAYRVTLGGEVELLGIDLEGASSSGQAPAWRPGGSLALTIHWKALKEMERSYTVFVQLLDSQGRLVAQEDVLAARGERPTTGWLPGEVVSDRHTLDIPEGLPAGRYALIAGLYEALSGRRLETAGGDFVSLMEVAVRDE